MTRYILLVAVLWVFWGSQPSFGKPDTVERFTRSKNRLNKAKFITESKLRVKEPFQNKTLPNVEVYFKSFFYDYRRALKIQSLNYLNRKGDQR